VLPTDGETVESCLTRIFQVLVDGKYVTPAEFGQLTGGLKPKRKSAAVKAAKGGKPPKAIKAAKPGKAAKAKPARAKPAARKAPKKAAARTARR